MTWKKVIKLAVALKDQNRYQYVFPLLSLKTPPKYINKQDYKGDTHNKTLDSRTKDTDDLKKRREKR